MDEEIKKFLVNRFYIEDGNLCVDFQDQRSVNLGKVVGEQGNPGAPEEIDYARIVQEVEERITIPDPIPGAPGIAPTLDEVVNALLPKIKAPKGDPGVAPTLEEVVEELLRSKSEFPKGDPGVAPTLDQVVKALLPLIKIPDPVQGPPGVAPKLEEVVEALLKRKDELPKGDPGKNAPFSTHIQQIDIIAVTNQDNFQKQIFEIPDCRFATITIDIAAVGNTQFISTKKSASFKANAKVGTEDLIERTTKKSNPEYDVNLIKTATGYGINIKGSPNEEMEWVGTVIVNAIA
jgi:hypothetical protein